MYITMAHGSGGKETSELIENLFAEYFHNEILLEMEDAAVCETNGKIAFTTDSFVIDPLIFRGGDIGKLAVCGTVNDLLMRGSYPKYLTVGFIIEEGLKVELLERIVISMALTAKQAGVLIVAGDTKVIEGKGGLYINTSGIGLLNQKTSISSSNCKEGDAVLLSGTLGEHHACILGHRMNIESNISSDVQPLNKPVFNLLEHSIRIKAMRDITRGGLATILNELAQRSQCGMDIYEDNIPVNEEIQVFCSILGLDPMYMSNEGKFIVVVDRKDTDTALELMHQTLEGKNATLIGYIKKEKGIRLITKLGARRNIDMLYGESLPRIC